MGREHGTRARYVMGEGPGKTPGCRCGACTAANRAAMAHRERQRVYGRWQPYVDAGEAREHVRMLGAAGLGWKRAGALAGVSNGAMSKLLYGGPGGRPPSRRIRPETAAALLAVRPASGTLGSAALTDATGTRRRLQALVTIGWPKSRLAARLGMLPANFGDVMTRDQVTAGTARAVAALYDELWDTAPAEGSHREKIGASRARNYARARGWVPPLAWDDDAIDDPGAVPAGGWQRKRDVPRGAELAEEAAELAAMGVHPEMAAVRLGVARETAERAVFRARKAAVA